MWLILRITKVGKLLRAATEHGDMVGLLGYNVGALFTVVFVVAAGLAGLAGVVIAPTIRLALGMDTPNHNRMFSGSNNRRPGECLGRTIGRFDNRANIRLRDIGVGKVCYGFSFFALAALIIIFKPSGLLGKSAE